MPGPRSRSASLHALQPTTKCLLLLPVRLPFGEGLALVPGLLALGQGDLDLGAAVLEVERQGDQGEPLLVDPGLDPVDLLPVQQELALTPGGVVGPGALG